jgi:pimeloyl-ACP methyl ester carboxylesterase
MQLAGDATDDLVLATREDAGEMRCNTATLGEEPMAIGDHRRARLRRGHRRSCVDDVYVTTRDGVQLAVRDGGSLDARHTVVFLHGVCLNQETWVPEFDYLLRRSGGAVRVISYDHRGHGRSGQAPMSSYRIEQLADDLAQVLTARRVSGPLTLVGHSMGGMVALCYLARPAADRPVEPDGLVLAATAAGKISERGLGRALATPATGALFRLIDHTPGRALRALARTLCATLDRCVGGNLEQETLAALVATALASTPLQTAVGFLPSLRSYDQYRTLGSIRANTIIVSGGADALTPPSHSRDLAAGIPGAALVHLPTAGHLLPQHSPNVINAAIRRVMRPSKTARAASPGITRSSGQRSWCASSATG